MGSAEEEVSAQGREVPLTKHIGIVGVSPEGAALCVRHLSRHAAELLEPHEHPRISLHNEPLAYYIDAIRAGDWHGVADLLRRSAEILADCGADFCISPDNAIQYAIHLAEHDSPIPWLSIPDLVADAITRDGRDVVGLVGTKWVTSGATYQTRLGLRGVQVLVPEPDEADAMDRMIVGELIFGRVRPESRAAFLTSCGRLADRGCQGLILGSSEVPLVLRDVELPMPIYDAADILTARAVAHAAGRDGTD